MHNVTVYANDTSGNMGGSTVCFTVRTSQKGDLNGDNEITPSDAAIALAFAAADVSGDGRVTSRDALIILQTATGAITL